MNPDLQKLLPYPFERLNRLKAGSTPPDGLPHISLAIGEPRHEAPNFVTEGVIAHLHGLANYPATKGGIELRETIVTWLNNRFALPVDSLDPERHVLPVNGTREALFAFAQCMIDRSRDPLVLMPNPFYQIYEGAALLAGATPWFLNCTQQTQFLPDIESVPEGVWRRCQVLYLCTPGNPTGAVMHTALLQRVIELADKYDFVIASDECYSEIYLDEKRPPVGLLETAAQMGRDDYRRCVVFHSLSKRSNVPGLRSGFVAGDAELIEPFLNYRTYHGCAMPLHTQAASVAAWRDEEHVRHNRERYRMKFDAVQTRLSTVLNVTEPDAGFYLWPETPVDDTEFTKGLYERMNVTVLPGSYLSRFASGINPGQGRVRMAMVPPLEDCVEAAERICEFIGTSH